MHYTNFCDICQVTALIEYLRFKYALQFLSSGTGVLLKDWQLLSDRSNII